jgi:HAD superfamily hydrolase (TIGR01450 family)
LTTRPLSEYKAFLFDLDGCIYFSDVLAPGAKDLLNQLRLEQKKVCFVTNNSRETAFEVSKKLYKMGIQVEPEEIITATEYVGKYIKEQYGCISTRVAGSSSLQDSLKKYGHCLQSFDSKEPAEMIVVGRDLQFDYAKLQQIVEEACKGACVVSTNPDIYHPGSCGERVPETGALVTAIEAMLGKKVEYVGKPAPYLFQYGMEVCGYGPEESVMVGDNLNTDIAGGLQVGMTTAWIKGHENDQELNENKPDFIVNTMKELVDLYNMKPETV